MTEPDGERIARLETRMDGIGNLLEEIRDAQKDHTALINRAMGGAKVLGLLGVFSGLGTGLHVAAGWLGIHLQSGSSQ